MLRRLFPRDPRVPPITLRDHAVSASGGWDEQLGSGAFGMRLCVGGRWEALRISDALPVSRWQGWAFCGSKGADDAAAPLWPMLLEKAAAKSRGGLPGRGC